MTEYDQKTSILAELELRRREEKKTLSSKYDWKLHARPAQLAPGGNWDTWIILAGRGFGKTRSGAEWIRDKVENSEVPLNIALVGDTPADVRKVMIEGPSGILTISPPWFKPIYQPSIRRLSWPNGSIATTFSYNNPKQIRGPQHHFAWCDELVNADVEEVWDNLMFGMRMGENPQVLVTTTPKPKPLIKRIIVDKETVITGGSTYDNKANLPEKFIHKLENKYEGTRLGRQEIYAEILEDVEGALWTAEIIARNKISTIDKTLLSRIVVSVDPSASSDVTSDETGIVVCGLGKDMRGYVLADGTLRGTPSERAHQVKRLFDFWQADYVVAEKNNGGDMIEFMLKTVDSQNKMKIKLVWASRGKFTRAEPISSLYEQNKISHVSNNKNLDLLEDEMCSWQPGFGASPNRVDALVWGFSELMLQNKTPTLRML